MQILLGYRGQAMTDQYNNDRVLDRERFKFIVVKESTHQDGGWCIY